MAGTSANSTAAESKIDRRGYKLYAGACSYWYRNIDLADRQAAIATRGYDKNTTKAAGINRPPVALLPNAQREPSVVVSG